jgi:hypothetical protein
MPVSLSSCCSLYLQRCELAPWVVGASNGAQIANLGPVVQVRDRYEDTGAVQVTHVSNDLSLSVTVSEHSNSTVFAIHSSSPHDLHTTRKRPISVISHNIWISAIVVSPGMGRSILHLL